MAGIWEILFGIVSFLFLIQFVFAFILCNRHKNNERPELPRIKNLSVIIPFHNEETRIDDLIESLNNQKIWPENIELIFVNDFSDDKTVEVIEQKLKRPFRFIHQSKKKGKKQAIHEGVQNAQHDVILTLDADVKPGENYFNALFKLPQTDMIILPVTMVSKTIFQELSSIEFGWLQLLTYGSKKPILCSGANLLFRKSAYQSSFKTRTDFNIASGDDVFLLQTFIASGKKADRFVDDELAVETKAPAGLMNLLRQRKRWLSKFSKMADIKNTKLVLFLLLLQIAFVLSVIAIPFYPYFLFLIVLKIISEFMASINYRHSAQQIIFPLTIINQIWYPIYLLLLCLPIRSDAKWKHLDMEIIDAPLNEFS